MIHEVDEAVRSFLREEALVGTEVEILLDAPTKDWAGRRTAPAVDLYLYDIREDVRRRTVGTVEARRPDGTVVDRRDPLRHFKLAYLLTAWTQRPEDEHRLLSGLLACLLRHDSVPAPHMVGSLAESGLPLGLTVASPPPENRQVSDVWSALGGELKASLDLVVTVHVDPARITVPAPPIFEPLRVTIRDEEGGRSEDAPRRPEPARP
ncbi:MAG: DUF4255 domain-containing protein [Acidimicrobiales bacterium]